MLKRLEERGMYDMERLGVTVTVTVTVNVTVTMTTGKWRRAPLLQFLAAHTLMGGICKLRNCHMTCIERVPTRTRSSFQSTYMNLYMYFYS